MKEFLKNAGIKFYISVVAFVLTLVAWIIMLVSNAVVGYSLQNAALSITFGVISLVVMAAGIVLSFKLNLISDILMFIAFILVGVALSLTLADRVYLASGLFTWDHDNALGWQAFYTALTSVVFYLVTEVALIVAAFMSGKKES